MSLRRADFISANGWGGRHMASLKTALSGRDGAPRTLLVTSSHRNEGVTTVAVEIAGAFAASEKVLLLDANLRAPDLHRRLGVSQSPGLADILRGEIEASEVVRPVAGRLHLLGAGLALPASEQALIGSQAMASCISTLREQFDRVVIDASAALEFPEPILLAPRCDGVVLVVEAGKTKWEIVDDLKTKLEQAGARLQGLVLNKKRLFIPAWLYRRV